MSHERYNVENENHNGKTVIDVPYREVRSRQHQTFGANGRNQGKRNKREKNRAGKYVKRMGMLAMSAVMFGALAAGSFQGVHYLTGYETAQQSEEQESRRLIWSGHLRILLQTQRRRMAKAVWMFRILLRLRCLPLYRLQEKRWKKYRGIIMAIFLIRFSRRNR